MDDFHLHQDSLDSSLSVDAGPDFGLVEELSSTWRAMSMHPRYLESFEKTHNYLLRGNGPLTAADRHYLALMAATRHSCSEVVEHHLSEFKSHHSQISSSSGASSSNTAAAAASVGSDWCLGVDFASERMKRIDEINRLLAHQPWKITKEVIERLTTAEDKWSMSQLMHAVVLIAHFHAFSAFVKGCAHLKATADRDGSAEDETATSVPTPDSIELAEDALEGAAVTVLTTATAVVTASTPDVPSIMERMVVLSKKDGKELDISELARRFESLEYQAKEDGYASAIRERHVSSTSNGVKAIFSRHLDFAYVDFVNREEPSTYPTFRSNDFNWNNHAYTVMEMLFGETASKLLDGKYRTIKSLTYMTIGSYTDVDTTMFRVAVMHYIQCLFGIRHDDYDYGQINELLARPLKKFIKAVCCYPERCTQEDYDAAMPGFQESEKVHVCLLVCEARFHASILYALRAVAEAHKA